MAFSLDEDESPASPDPVLPSNLENASVNELMNYLEQLKMKLIQMTNGSSDYFSSDHIPVIPLNLQVPQSQSTADFQIIPRDNSSNCATYDVIDDANDLNDNEEEELRKIAMMSLRPREIEKTPAVRSPSPMSLSPLPEDDYQIKTFDDRVTLLAPSQKPSRDEEDDAEALRLQALHSITKKNNSMANSSNIAAIVPAFHSSSSNVIPQDVSAFIPTASSTSASVNRISPAISSVTASASHNQQERIIIYYGGDSSSDGDSDDDEDISNRIEALKKKISLGQAGSSPAEALKNLKNANVNLSKLTEKERREYLVLKEEIAKLDSLMTEDAPQLCEAETEYRKLKKTCVEMKKEHLEAKKHYLKMRQQLLGAQLHERKMREAYLAASKVVAHSANLSKQAEEVATCKEKLVSQNVKETKECLAKCLMYGRKIEGDTYTKPLVKKPVNRLIKLEKRKKKLEYRQLSLLQLIAKRNEEEAQAKRKCEERKKAEERIRKNKEDLSELINDFTRNDLSKSILLISHMKDICSSNHYYPDMLGTFFGRDSHRNNKPPVTCQAASTVNSLRPLDLSHVSRVSSGHKYSPSATQNGGNSDSPLLCLSSFRLNRCFEAISGDLATSDLYCNRIDSSKALCSVELADGTCQVKDCSMQHSKTYLLSEIEKLVDIISFDASIANVTPEELTGQPGSKEYNSVRRKMENFASKYRQIQPNEPFNCVAGQLIRLVRDRIKDRSILETTRVKCATLPVQQQQQQQQQVTTAKTKQNVNGKKKKIPFRNSGVNSNKINSVSRKKFPNRKKVKGK